MDRSYFAFETQAYFMPVFTSIAVWFLVKWVRHALKNTFTLRDWLGAIAFWLGILSTAAYAYIYAHFWMTHELLLTEGQSWYYLCDIDLKMAVGGVLIGFAGRGWVRRAAVFISTAMAFKWADLLCPPQFKNPLAGAMFGTLAAGTLLWFGFHLLFQHIGSSRSLENHGD